MFRDALWTINRTNTNDRQRRKNKHTMIGGFYFINRVCRLQNIIFHRFIHFHFFFNEQPFRYCIIYPQFFSSNIKSWIECVYPMTTNDCVCVKKKERNEFHWWVMRNVEQKRFTLEKNACAGYIDLEPKPIRFRKTPHSIIYLLFFSKPILVHFNSCK